MTTEQSDDFVRCPHCAIPLRLDDADPPKPDAAYTTDLMTVDCVECRWGWYTPDGEMVCVRCFREGKHAPIVDWTGCYKLGWRKAGLIPDAFAHPAKFAPGLIDRIFQHGTDRGWWHSGGDVIVNADLLRHLKEEIAHGRYTSEVSSGAS